MELELELELELVLGSQGRRIPLEIYCEFL
jgi:hypothetical protein